MSMKVCKRGLNDIWINENNGQVRICGWSNFYIGSLLESTIEEIWHGEKAKAFRESMLDGSYRYCNHAKCPHCANEQLEDMLVEYKIPELPKYASLSYQLQCNYACKFCRTEHYIPCECERNNYIKIESEIKKMLPGLQTLSSNGAGEFFCSDSIMHFISENTINPKTNILIETNGSLFNEMNWKKIEKLGKHNLEVAVTVHSFNEDTYKYLSGTNLPVKNIMDNLKFISKLRDEGIINKFEIATVICERNFRDMPQFVEKCLNEYSMDKIRLRFFEPYGVMDTSTEWFYDVRNEFHPYYDEFVSVMSNKIFDNPKVWKWQGNTKSLQSENPFVLEKRRGIALAQLILSKDDNKVADFIQKHNINKVALYGASDIGKACAKLLNAYGIGIHTIFDTYSCNNDEIVQENDFKIHIVEPNESNINDFDLIIVTTDTYYVQIHENLMRLQYKGRILSLSEIMNWDGEICECC